MAQIKSAAKQQRKALKHRARNIAALSALRTAIKKARVALDAQSPDAPSYVRHAVSAIDTAVTRGILKRKTGSRYVSRLARRGARELDSARTAAMAAPSVASAREPVAVSDYSSAIEMASSAAPNTNSVAAVATTNLKKAASRPSGARQQRIVFLNAAERLVCAELPITMRPNGGGAEANNRMGRFARAVNVGVVAVPDEIRVHLHSTHDDRQTIFREIADELAAGSMQQPLGLSFELRPAPVARNLLYLEASWRPIDFNTDDLARVGEAAKWLAGVRRRF